MVSKHTGPFGTIVGTFQLFDQIMAIEDVVTQHQGAGALAHKFLADDESLGQAIRAGLNGILNIHAPLAAVTEQVSKMWRVMQRADQEHVAHP